MCGICGFNWRDPDLVEKMTGVMVHRGPDQGGAHSEDGISLGHRRLSIIDLSEQGRQPMTNENGRLQLVFNGEIYNYSELRERLTSRGHHFRSKSDSEVILHGYEEYGYDVLSHLRGMFAFAIWDSGARRLFLARDRIGIKPLYYWFAAGKFVFASEIKSILTVPGVPREVNHQALFDYLGFEFVPAPETCFRGIHKLPAGHYALLEDGELRLENYWDLRFSSPGSDAASFDESVERLRALLEESVSSHLMSDVPLGVFLSGGLDSSAIVAMMRKHISGTLKTFSIGYSDRSYSELDFAKTVADQFETEHHVIMLDDITQDDVERSIWHFDEPMTDLSSIPLMLACRKAKESITVCLSGEGGDESFAGYDRFKASKINRYYQKLPRLLREQLIHPLAGSLRDRPAKKARINMLKRFLEGSELSCDGYHLRWQYFLCPDQAKSLLNPALYDQLNPDPFRQLKLLAAGSDAKDPVNLEIYLDSRFMMSDSVLMKVDKMSMSTSLEVRVPLLDHMLVEHAATMPGHWKLKGLQTKHAFRAALKGVLPDKIVYRGKQGYSLPMKHLLRGKMKKYMTDQLNGSQFLRDCVNTDSMNQLIKEHLDETHNHNHVLWGLITIAAWHRRFFE
jgi:asparagine synthase (glutamine-hydrolysing)